MMTTGAQAPTKQGHRARPIEARGERAGISPHAPRRLGG